MFHYNLLPIKYQKNTRRWMILKHVTNGLVLLNIFLIVGVGVLYVGNMALGIMFERSQERVDYLQEHSDLIVTDIASINKRISSLENIQTNHNNYLGLITEIATVIPDGIKLNEKRIDFDASIFYISGTAKDRTALHLLQDNLNMHELFTISSFPYEAYTQTDDISFTIEVLFKNVEY